MLLIYIETLLRKNEAHMDAMWKPYAKWNKLNLNGLANIKYLKWRNLHRQEMYWRFEFPHHAG